MSEPHFTIERDDRPVVELQDTAAGILVTTFGRPTTLSDDEAERLRDALSAMLASRKPSTAVHLTDRETEVLGLLASGFSNKAIAHRLSLSVRTVETHRLNLRQKTRTGDRSELVAMARERGIGAVA